MSVKDFPLLSAVPEATPRAERRRVSPVKNLFNFGGHMSNTYRFYIVAFCE